MLDPFLRWPAPVSHHHSTMPHHGPRVNAHEDDNSVYFELEVPRYRPEDIQVTTDLDAGILTISGKRQGTGPESHFERRFSVLTDIVDLVALQSNIELGLLTVKVPKKPKAALPPPPAPGTLSVPEAGALTSPSFTAATKMSWPPKFEAADTATELVYSTTGLPKELAPDNIDVHLERGGDVSVTVRAHLENIKRNEQGEIVFSESRSVQYSTHLAVPRNTQPSDIAVSMKDGALRVVVAKHLGSTTSKITVSHS